MLYLKQGKKPAGVQEVSEMIGYSYSELTSSSVARSRSELLSAHISEIRSEIQHFQQGNLTLFLRLATLFEKKKEDCYEVPQMPCRKSCRQQFLQQVWIPSSYFRENR